MIQDVRAQNLLILIWYKGNRNGKNSRMAMIDLYIFKKIRTAGNILEFATSAVICGREQKCRWL